MPHTSSSIVEGLTRRIFSEHTMGAASHSPGMGEMLEAHFTTSPVPSAPRHRTPGLGIDLMQVDATSRRDRIHRFAARGVVVFLLVDLCVLLWMGWVRVRKWWTDEPHPVHKAVPVSTGSQIGLKPVAEAAPKTPAVVAPSTVATTKPGPAPVSNIVAETGNKKDTSAPPTLPTLPQASVMNLPLPALPGLDLGNPLTRPPAELMNSTGDLVAPSTIASINPPFPSSSPPETPKTTVSNDTKPVLDSTPPMAAPNAILAPIITDPSKSPSSPPPIPPLPSDPLKPPPEVAMTLAKADHLPMAFGPTEPVDPPPPAQPDVATHPPADLPVSKIIETGVPPEAASALKAVKAFLAATTWKERLQWSQKPETIKAAMEKHYRTFPDGPVNVTHVDFIQRFPSKGDTPPYCMFEVRGPSMTHPVLMLVDQPLKKDARVDWETFIEFKDDLLFKFLKKSSTTPGRFRVMMRRAHVFDKDLPDRENKAGFEVFTPNSDFKGSVYVRKGSDTSRQLDIKLPWNNDVPVIVELIWRGQGEQTWVELQSVVSYGWRA